MKKLTLLLLLLLRSLIIKTLFIILGFCLFSCKKEVNLDYRPEFVGYWAYGLGNGDFVHLDISDEGNAQFALGWEGKEYYLNGTARANDKHFKIGRLAYFNIVEYPHKIDTTIESAYVELPGGRSKRANWKMVLEGPKNTTFHFKGESVYYKADY